MLSVAGIVGKGHGVASGAGADKRFPRGTIKLQTPFFKAQGLDLDRYFDGNWISGTLNADIAPKTFRILQPDYRLANVKWVDIFPPENFSLADLSFRFKGNSYRGLLYHPDPVTKPDHFKSPTVMEIIAETVPGIAYGDRIEIDLDPRKIEIAG